MSHIKVLKKLPFTLDKFDDFFRLLSLKDDKQKETEKSWFLSIETIKSRNYDLKAVNPNIKEKEIPKPEELIKIIEESQMKIDESLKRLKELL